MFEPYGLVGGLSVGIPAVQVIDENGNIISNVATTGNVSANIVTANAFKFANGANFTTQAAGTNTQVQFNDNNNFAGDANFTFDSTQALLTVSNLNITGLTSLGDISNVTILGGNNGYFLQTDGAGVLTWAPASGGGGGNGTPGGANTQVQYNKSGDFGGDSGFTYNDTTNTLQASYINATTFTGNLVGNASRAGTVTTAAQPNITSVGTLTSLSVAGAITATGNISGANANLGNTVIANYFVGNFYGSANTAQTVTASSQPNITSLGNLVELTVDGELSANDATLGNSVVANYFTGTLYGPANTAGTVTSNSQPNITSVGQLTNLVVTGNVTASNFIGNVTGNATTAGTVTSNSQPNITSLGTLTGLTVNGNVTAGNSVTSNYFIGRLYGAANTASTVTTNAQPNITSLGTLTSLAVTSNITAGNISGGNLVSANYLSGTLTTAAQANITSVGTLTQLNVNGNIVASNITANTGVISGNGSGLHHLTGANVTGLVANATHAITANTANTTSTVTSNAQPNITSVGTLVDLSVSGNVTAGNVIGGNLASANYLSGTLTTAAQPNITTVGTLTSLAVVGNIVASNITANTGVISGNGSGLHHLTGANVTGVVANAQYAANSNISNIAGTITENAQPNITSTGTLISLNVTGNVVAGNANLGNSVVANFFVGDGGYLSNLQISNASVSNANYASYAGNITIAGQSNITTVGNLTNLVVVGNSNLGNVATANLFVGNLHGYSNRVTDNAQPNITSVGTLVDLGVTGNITAGNVSGGNLVSANYLSGTLTTAAQSNITTVGTLNGLSVNGNLVASNITANTGVISGNGSGLHHLTGANVTGTVANANYSVYANYSAFAGFVTDNAQPNISSVGPLVTLEVDGNIYVNTNSFLGNIAYANYFVGNGNGLSNINGSNVTQVANANYATYAGQANFANTVIVNAQPNITSVGNLTSLIVTGQANFTGNLRSTGNLRAVGNVNFGGSPNIYLGDISNLHIAGGFANYVLTTGGSGNLQWTSSGSIGLSPGGSNTAVQYNANGVFGGSNAYLFDTNSNTLTLTGNFIADALQMGVGPNAFYKSTVYAATTSSMDPDQLLWSVPVTEISGVEFVIIATDETSSSRQTCKIFATCYGNVVTYNEYAGLSINMGVGSFDVDYDSITDSLRLLVTPDNMNLAVYKILITQYAP